MSQYKVKYIHQFLLVITNLQIMYDKISNVLFDFFNDTVIYSVKHDLLNPYYKTYSNIFLPWIYVSINYNRYTFLVSTNKYNFIKYNKNYNFYETCIIHNRKFVNIISNKHVKKVTSDFTYLPFLFVHIMNHDISNKIKNLLTNIKLSANHICVLFKKDLATPITCHTNTLDTYVFKDIDIIK